MCPDFKPEYMRGRPADIQGVGGLFWASVLVAPICTMLALSRSTAFPRRPTRSGAINNAYALFLGSQNGPFGQISLISKSRSS